MGGTIMFCPNCGSNLPDKGVFCTNCGVKLPENATSNIPSPPPYVFLYEKKKIEGLTIAKPSKV